MVARRMTVLILAFLSLSAFADTSGELIDASKNGQEDEVVSLIEAGADVNAIDANRNTAVRLASEHGHKEIVLLLIDAGAEISSVLNESSVRMRDKPTTQDSRTIGSLDAGDQVVVLGKSPAEQVIGSMTAYWYRIRTEEGVVGFSYGFFSDIDSRDLEAVPTFYFNAVYGYSISFPVTWEGWTAKEQEINFGFGVPPVSGVYFGLPDQEDIFVVSAFSEDQWDQLSQVEPPDGVEGDPVARNNRYLFDYSVGHYAANDEMYKRRGEIQGIMRTFEVEDVDS
jgi:hypothetical protein